MAVRHASISSFHTASPEFQPFTVYVLRVELDDKLTHTVYRRYREFEDLRMRLLHQLGSAPSMPPKTLFGRMRPEIIESRILGLNHFLQLCINTPMYAAHRSFLEFLEKNHPPDGFDVALLDPVELTSGQLGGVDDERNLLDRQLKQIVATASHAFISLSQEAPQLDAAYLQERSRMLAAAIRVSERLPPCLVPGTTLSLRNEGPGSPAEQEAAIQKVLHRMHDAMDAPTSVDAAEARRLASSVAAASECKIDPTREVLIPVG